MLLRELARGTLCQSFFWQPGNIATRVPSNRSIFLTREPVCSELLSQNSISRVSPRLTTQMGYDASRISSSSWCRVSMSDLFLYLFMRQESKSRFNSLFIFSRRVLSPECCIISVDVHFLIPNLYVVGASESHTYFAFQ